MALIDVSELLVDADFCDDFKIIRRKAVVNEYGENVLTESVQSGSGVVQSAIAETLKVLPESVQLSSAIKVYYKGELNAETEGHYADVIEWYGERYIVMNVEMWHNWGAGYCCATCILESEAR